MPGAAMRSTRTLFFSIGLVAVVVTVTGARQADSSRQAVADAMKEGHWADALKIARLRLDSGDAEGVDLRDAAASLRRLGRLNEFDSLIEKTIEQYRDDPSMLVVAMREYDRTPSYGYEVAGEFRRGQERGRGASLSIEEADRVRMLRLGERVLGLVDAEENKAAYAALDKMNDALQTARRGDLAWRLQQLTDLDAQLPEPDSRWSGSISRSDPPVTPEGDLPVLYEVPASWDAAKSDGERWRWVMAEIARRRPELADRMIGEYANFLHEQFGVQSLAQSGWFRPSDDASPSDETSALAVETLDDSETIARLATGVRRFTLPEGHRFVEMFREAGAWSTLHEVYLNRNQRPQAAEAARRVLEQIGDSEKRKPERERWQAQLAQVVDPWVRFEATEPQPAGKGAELRVTHRNADRVALTAKPVDVAKLLADVREVLTNPPEEFERQDLQVEQIGHRLIRRDGKKYLGEAVAEWSVDVERPADHRDAAQLITTPLQAAGAYLVTAVPEGENQKGEAVSVVVWVADTALVRKPTADGALYQALDARDGQPIEGATVDLFGYRQDAQRLPNGRRTPRVETTRRVGATDAQGLAVLEIAPEENERPYTWLTIATTAEGRLAHLGFAGLWRASADDDPPSNPRTFVVTDRPVYRPGDTVKHRVWIGRPNYLASIDAGEAKPSEFAFQEFKVDFYDARGDKIASKRLTADQHGALSGELLTTEAASLGQYRIDVVGFGSGSFRVEEYRKPEFEVFVDAPQEPTALGESFDAVVRANYYSGAPVAGARVAYKVVRTRKTDRWLPPRPWDWLYGRGYGWLGQDATWRADWSRWGCPGPLPPWWPQPSGPPEVVAQGEATLDAQGRLQLPIDTGPAKERLPNTDHQYEITAEVTDAGRRTIVGSGSVLAARRPVDVTVWLSRGFYDVGDTVRASISVRRPDGAPVAAAGELRLLRVEPPKPQPENPGGEPVELVEPDEKLVQTWTLPTDETGAASMRLKASEPGRYRLAYKSAAADAAVEGALVFTIRGPGFDSGDFRYGALEIVPDKAEYAPGDTAKLLINTDRADSTVSLYLRPVNGVYTKPQVLRVDGKSTLVEVDITAGDLPNFYVEVTTVADGQVHVVAKRLVVPPESRVLQVEASPSAKTLLPGQEGKLQVRLTDAEGEPVVGAATIAVYDRSVEAIAGGPSGGDIRETFWNWTRQHSPNTTHNLDRSEWPVTAEGVPAMQTLGVFGAVHPRLGRSIDRMFFSEEFGAAPADASMSLDSSTRFAKDFAMSSRSSGEFGDADKAAEPEVAVRKDFADTALWVASVQTDSSGMAELTMPLPESLTSWKVRAWAVAPGLRVGQGEAEVVTRKDLMVRLRTPRFLVDGDRATFSALVQNQSSRELSARVRLEIDGSSISTPTTPEQTVTIPAGGEQLVDWSVDAASAGNATVRAIAIADGEPPLTDAMQVELPVLVHGAEIVDSFSAVIGPDEGLTTFTLVVPEKRRPEATRLEVRYSPTLVGAMLDTLPYLLDYPHGCTEQTLNRFLPAVIVRQTLTDLGVDLAELKPAEGEADAPQPPDRPNPVFDADELDKIVRQGVNRLVQMQLSDGGWGWFSGLGEQSSPHTTAVVVRGLGIARQSGVAAPEEVLSRGLDWLAAYRERQLAALANADDKGNRADEGKPYKPHADNLDALVELTLGQADRANATMLGRLYDDRLQLAPYSLATLGMALHLDASRDGQAGVARVRDDSADRRSTVLRNLKQFLRTDDENQTAYLDLPGGYWWYWYGSEYEAHAFFLKLLAATEPKGELAPKVVKHLLANRRHATRWNSTRDTALVVEAMADYVKASGEASAEGAVEVWLDGKKRQTKSFDPKSALRFEGRFELAGEELSAGRHTLELRKTGGGRLYAGAALTNFSLDDDLRAAGLEVRVTRRVQKLVPVKAEEADVDTRGQAYSATTEKYRRVDVPNLGEIKSGELVEVELTIASKNDYEYLIIEDAKPAGFEPVEVRSGYNGNAIGAYVEFRDETVRFYARSLARGERTVTYRLRAETPGKFSALPAQISAMYAPDLRGNSDEVKLSVKDQ